MWQGYSRELVRLPAPVAPKYLAERTRARVLAQRAAAAERRWDDIVLAVLVLLGWTVSLVAWVVFRLFSGGMLSVVETSFVTILEMVGSFYVVRVADRGGSSGNARQPSSREEDGMSRFSQEVRIVPRVAWAIAVLAYGAVSRHVDLLTGHHPNMQTWPSWGRTAFCGLMPLVLIPYIALIGYVNADARRRGMRSVMWTLLAIFIANGLGIILYFVLREPDR